MTIASPTGAARKPIRARIPGLLDIVAVRHAEQIKWLNDRAEIVRTLDPQTSWLHRLLHQQLMQDLRLPDGTPLPAFLDRNDPKRARRQKELEDQFDELRGLPGPERDKIAAFVSGKRTDGDIGVTVQHWCGRLFHSSYRASEGTYAAGKLLADWVTSPPWKTLFLHLTGRLAEAKREVFEAARGDSYCVHATTIGMRHITEAVQNLRRAALRPDKRRLAPDEILRECLVVPPALVRTCTANVDVPFLDQPLTSKSLVIFLTASAYKESGDDDVAFLAEGWSACPARDVVPEMLRAVWHAAHHDEADSTTVFEKIDRLRRLIPSNQP